MNKQHKTTSVVLSLVSKLHKSLFGTSAAPLIEPLVTASGFLEVNPQHSVLFAKMSANSWSKSLFFHFE